MPDLVAVLEGVAVIAGFAYVWFNIRQNIWTWPAAIFSSALFGVVFFDSSLYATMTLQGLFITIAIYGWKKWLTGGRDGGVLRVSRLSLRLGLILLAVTVLIALLLASVLATYTDSQYPQWDAITTALSVTASWMVARKILENWLVWIVTDIVYVGLYMASGLYLTTLLYAAYLILAAIGYVTWRRSYRTNVI